MAIEGLHHITAITGDAPANVDFYARLLGLRLVKKTVNFDQPDVYHLYYADETGDARLGADVLRVPRRRARAPRRRHGPHRSSGACATATRSGSGRTAWRATASTSRGSATRCASPTPRGSTTSCWSTTRPTRRWSPHAPDIPAETHCSGSTACAPTRRPGGERADCCARWASAGAGDAVGGARRERGALLRYDAPPALPGIQSAGSVHHIAWSVADDAELDVRARGGGRQSARRRRRSSTASTSTRSTSASPAACCSSSRRATSASTSTSRWRRSGRSSSCRRSTRRGGRSWRRR